MKNQSIWYPYSLMKEKDAILDCKSAKGVEIYLENGKTLIDGVSSWWSVIHGYNHPRLNKAAIKQLKKVSHIMLGGFQTEATKNCAKKLLSITDHHFDKVFFADSGSVGCEVAIKMAYQYWINLNNQNRNCFITLKGGYHGDTFANMALCDPNDGMHQIFKKHLIKHFFLDLPKENESPSSLNFKKTLSETQKFISKNHHKIAGFIVEPIFQGASSMRFYSVSYLNELIKICKTYEILIIFDEVATGFGRLGTTFAYEQCDHKPDILVLGKGLTGGYLALSATLASKQVYDSFFLDNAYPFMHGPTFTGNPLACQIAFESISIFESEKYLEKIKIIERILQTNLMNWENSLIKDIRCKGAIAVIEVKDKNSIKGLQRFAIKEGVWIRPFSNFVYLMPSYVITTKQLEKIITTIKNFFDKN